jgi:hypothetical protein
MFAQMTETPCVLGDSSNELVPTNAVYNISEAKAVQAISHHAAMACSHAELTAAAATTRK